MKKNRFDVKIDLEIRNLSCWRQEKPILENIGFELGQGKCLLLRGPNGSGKSTMLLCLSNILPYSGDISWLVGDKGGVGGDETEISHLVHFITAQTAMKPALSLAENLAFWAAMSGDDDSRVAGALEKSGLGGLDDFAAGHLSTGQKHRLSLARLLVSPRPIWLLDEPSSTLDAQGDQWVGELIDDHLKNNGMVIAATHRSIPLNRDSTVHTLDLGAS
ncbi:ABC transporter involved in cytochrome c biogenesis, ATPase component CcmA [hydrothermal vent metagenome]|uniref:ABC transporter involved in cytochrome c biogenesis, ATPase component CcmA n=1 Tax=hydrothermal vent metagenome TaxID=652676 RepID=A0A3B0TQ56_9ZZZZ